MRTALPSSRDRLSAAAIVLFWLPLAATWFMMALEGPYIAAIVARMPEAAHGLAAIGVATSLAWLIESPIMMLLSAATALVRDGASYLALRRFAALLNALVTLGMAILAIPPVFRLVAETMIGLPPEIARLTHVATAILIPWPAAIGYRRFYQGILVRHHATRRVAYGTAIRLGTMSATAALLAALTSLSGAAVGAIALLAGVVLEAGASRWMARHFVASLLANREISTGALLSLRDIGRFYFPLALTSVLSMAMGPVVTFGLGRARAPIESLAVWPVIGATAFLFRSGGVAFQEVGIALTGARSENARLVRATGGWLGLAASLALAALALTPLHEVWFQRISGLTPHLAEFAVWPVRILILLPLLEYVLAMQRARWILAQRTAVITLATAIEAAGTVIALILAIGRFDLVGAVGGAIAMMAGRLAANAYLFAVAREPREVVRGK